MADLDKNGISVQVLSCLTTQQLPTDEAEELVRKSNNTLAGAVRAHPDDSPHLPLCRRHYQRRRLPGWSVCVKDLKFWTSPRSCPVLRALVTQGGGAA